MGKILKHVSDLIIPHEPDRHGNRLSVYLSKGGQYRINFRNMQFRLSKAEFEIWKNAFNKAKEKLGDRMLNDVIVPIPPEESGRQRTRKTK